LRVVQQRTRDMQALAHPARISFHFFALAPL
jgi:hypothetical protein